MIRTGNKSDPETKRGQRRAAPRSAGPTRLLTLIELGFSADLLDPLFDQGILREQLAAPLFILPR
jgi:hypothetical protein